jgi:uncharacterized protein YdhG (YjbR/CyaY superfamily)
MVFARKKLLPLRRAFIRADIRANEPRNFHVPEDMREKQTMSAKEIDAYIARAPRGVRAKLKELRSAIKEVAPGANESISYRMPYYSYKGRLAWFALMKNHIGLYLRPPVIAEYKRELTPYKTTKSAVHFALDRKLPISLIKKLVRARMKKNEAERATTKNS